jgi:mRNA interferase HigB
MIEKYKQASESLEAWLTVVQQADWASPADLKAKFRNASIIDGRRVVFNIEGNEFRLVADIECRLKSVFIIWFGTHQEYQKINIKKLIYGNKNY